MNIQSPFDGDQGCWEGRTGPQREHSVAEHRCGGMLKGPGLILTSPVKGAQLDRFVVWKSVAGDAG